MTALSPTGACDGDHETGPGIDSKRPLHRAGAGLDTASCRPGKTLLGRARHVELEAGGTSVRIPADSAPTDPLRVAVSALAVLCGPPIG